MLLFLFFTLQTVCSARYTIAEGVFAAHVSIVFIFLFSSSYAIAFSLLAVAYTPEIVPYRKALHSPQFRHLPRPHL